MVNMLKALLRFLKRSLRPEPPPPPPPKYAFCESLGAHWNSPWHIRPLSELGKKMGGAADTLSLCGRKVAWDMKPDVNPHQLHLACEHCRENYQEILDKEK